MTQARLTADASDLGDCRLGDRVGHSWTTSAETRGPWLIFRQAAGVTPNGRHDPPEPTGAGHVLNSVRWHFLSRCKWGLRPPVMFRLGSGLFCR